MPRESSDRTRNLRMSIPRATGRTGELRRTSGGGGRFGRKEPSCGPFRAHPGKDAVGAVDERPQRRKVFGMEAGSFLFDFVGALIILLILIGALYTYTGNWPPLVVVQSGSMQHSDTESSLGVIDTGDLVFVKEPDGPDSVTTYVDGKARDERRYGSFGDVIIFKPNGDEDRTAIIHRAVVYLEWNATTYNTTTKRGGGFDIPSMGLMNAKGSITINGYEWPKELRTRGLTINLTGIIDKFRDYERPPHGGFLTKGDDNNIADQTTEFGGEMRWLEPVEKDWVIGRSVGELPWFGLIKLYIEGNRDYPSNSLRNLIVAFIVIVSLPFAVEFAYKGVSSFVRTRKEEEGIQRIPHRDRRSRKGPMGPPQRAPTGQRRVPPPTFGPRSRDL